MLKVQKTKFTLQMNNLLFCILATSNSQTNKNPPSNENGFFYVTFELNGTNKRALKPDYLAIFNYPVCITHNSVCSTCF